MTQKSKCGYPKVKMTMIIFPSLCFHKNIAIYGSEGMLHSTPHRERGSGARGATAPKANRDCIFIRVQPF
jgi:hypothetical protein